MGGTGGNSRLRQRVGRWGEREVIADEGEGVGRWGEREVIADEGRGWGDRGNGR